MTKHTPGPWTIRSAPEEVRNPAVIHWIDGAGGVPVADTKCNANTEANARLIAAAPELLAALEAIAQIDDPKSGDRGPTRYARHIAKCAIAKAAGGE